MTGMVRRGQRQPGAVIKSAGRAPRIALASIPASPVAGPSRARSAGVILRGWELITRPGCHRRPAGCNPEVYDEGFWSRVDAWVGQFGLTGPAGIVQASEVPGAG